jgi:PAS domain S-box-containing protein
MESAESIKILLVEDDSGDYILFKESLNDVKNNSYLLTWANTYDQALELVKKKEHDIYFFDYLLGAKTGLDLLQECLKIGIDSPIIILTGLGNPQTDHKAMELGAADYLVKDEINGEKLERCIRYCIEHSRLLKEVKASEEKFRSIFENSHDVIYLSDQNGMILDVNKSAERLLGYSREEMLSMNAAMLYENEADRLRFIEEIHQTGSCANFEVILVDKFGERKYCTLTANIQKIDEKGVAYYQGIMHDMTTRKKAEHDLMIAEKLAIAGKIARTLAHEVRNPLTNINLSIEQLEEYVNEEEYNQYFEIVKRNSKRINDLVTELMENSKPAELHESSSTPIQTIVNNTIELAKDRAKLKNIKIITELNLKKEKVLADESKLTIAVLNILMNAIEAVDPNTGIIQISSSCDKEKCYISIEDNGSGIERECLTKVFEPYYTSKPNGMGLGLATSHSIIHTHGGAINIESEVNRGTKFTIVLNIE